jgi:uncharacterized protein YgiB involved in biofilm formation
MTPPRIICKCGRDYGEGAKSLEVLARDYNADVVEARFTCGNCKRKVRVRWKLGETRISFYMPSQRGYVLGRVR